MSAKKLAAAGTVLAIAVSLLLSRHRHTPSVVAAPNNDVTASPALPSQRQVYIAPPAESVAVEDQDLAGGPPMIDQVSVDKKEVCRGEDNFATVKAHTLDGADYYLRIGMTDPESGRMLQGTRIPFHLDRQPTHPIRVSVEGRRRASFVDLPEIRVKDCDVPRRVNIVTRRSFDASDRVQFTASVAETRQPSSFDNAPFAPVSYEWDFGDGQTEVTTSADVMHSYEARSQASVVSVFLVHVRLKERGDRQIEGAITVPLTNRGFVPLIHENTVLVSAGVTRKEGSDEPQKIWLYHGYPQTVTIDRVEVVETAEGPQGEVTRREIARDTVLGFSSLAAGESRVLPTLDAVLTRAGRARSLVITGHTDDGKAATGSIALVGAPAVTASAEATTDDGHTTQ